MCVSCLLYYLYVVFANKKKNPKIIQSIGFLLLFFFFLLTALEQLVLRHTPNLPTAPPTPTPNKNTLSTLNTVPLMATPLLPVAARGRGKILLKTTDWTASSNHTVDGVGPPGTMSRRSTMSMARNTGAEAQQPIADYRDAPPLDRDERDRKYFNSSAEPSAGSGHNGSMERTKRPDQQYYQTKRPVSIERKPIFDDPPPPKRDHHDQDRRTGISRTFTNSMAKRNQPPAPPSSSSTTSSSGQRQSEPRENENPFTRNLSRGGRRDSTSSEVTSQRVISTSGGAGGGVRGGHHNEPMGGKGGGVAGFRLPDNYNNLPPRFKKKILQEHGLDPSILDNPRSNGIITDHLGEFHLLNSMKRSYRST